MTFGRRTAYMLSISFSTRITGCFIKSLKNRERSADVFKQTPLLAVRKENY